MNHAQQLRIVKKFFDGCLFVQRTKGKDYTTDGDVFKDLKEEASAMGVTPEIVLWIAMNKHYKAIRRYCRTGKTASEPIEMRLTDLVNFASLIFALKKGKTHARQRLRQQSR